MKFFISRTGGVLGAILALSFAAQTASADYITYASWTSNEGDSGNYILTISDTATAGEFDFNLTVSPWNAEALGLFIDLGNFDVDDVALGTASLSDVNPAGEVSVYATDTTDAGCGQGCNLDGLVPNVVTPDDPDGEWELVFRLGAQGFDGIQTFSWTVSGLIDSELGAATIDLFGIAGIRSQQFCTDPYLLPGGDTDDEDICGGSDKSYGSGVTTGGGPNPVPLPAAAWLFGSALIGAGIVGRRKKKAA